MGNALVLDSYIFSAIDDFKKARDDKWHDPVEGKKVNDLADGIAQLVLTSATSLIATIDHKKWRNIVQRIEDGLEMGDELREALQVLIAEQFLEGTWEMAERALELVRLTLSIDPTAQVRQFLLAVARTHILGLGAECAVMCRAAVDNALGDKYRTTGTEWPLNEHKQSTFALRVNRAESLGWLTHKTLADAKEVWARGSKSAHADPTVVIDRLETIRMTVDVLEGLYT